MESFTALRNCDITLPKSKKTQYIFENENHHINTTHGNCNSGNGTNCCWVSFEVQYKTASEQPIFAMCRHNFEKKAEELFYTSPSESGKIVNEYWKCSKCNLIKQ